MTAAPRLNRVSAVMLRFLILFVTFPLHAYAGGVGQEEGRAHKGPSAYHQMCARESVLCLADLAAGRMPIAPPMVLNQRRLDELRTVNLQFNRSIQSATDLSLYGLSDHWTTGGQAGDCEDYMIAKKQALLALGWSAGQLLYAVVEGVETPYHAVLVVRTDQGDLVLDNLRDEVRDWSETGYRFVVRQSAADPAQWVRVLPSRFAAGTGDPLDVNQRRP